MSFRTDYKEVYHILNYNETSFHYKVFLYSAILNLKVTSNMNKEFIIMQSLYTNRHVIANGIKVDIEVGEMEWEGI